ncbi:hypothetical protein C5I_0135875 [Pseudomonas syringae pv. syringae FF5]|nr:hypothetical protein C5I_0135875 [Pseudomonas syringae pv. syringae FF5]
MQRYGTETVKILREKMPSEKRAQLLSSIRMDALSSWPQAIFMTDAFLMRRGVEWHSNIGIKFSWHFSDS